MHRLDFQKIVENAEEGIFLISASGVIQYANRAGEEMLGYGPGRLVGIPLEHVVAPESLGPIFSDISKANLDSGSPRQYDLKMLTSDGRIRSGDARTAVVRSEGSITWIQAIIRDTTEENELRAKLLEEKRHSERLIEDSASVIIGADRKFRVTIFNKGASHVLGYTKEEVMGQNLFDLNILESELAGRMKGAPIEFAVKMPRTIEGWARTKAGNRVRISWSLGTTVDEYGAITGTIAIGSDITSQATLAELLQMRNRLLLMQTEISFLAASASNPRVLMEGGLKLMASNFNFGRGIVSKVEPNGTLIEIGSIGEPPTGPEAAIHDRAIHLALTTGEPLFLPEDAAGLGFDDPGMENRSIVILPLRGRSGIVGVMCLCAGLITLDEERKNSLVSLASIYGFALENALLTERLNRAKDQLQLYNDMITHDVVNYAMPLGTYIDLLSRKDLPEEKKAAYLQKMKDAARLLDEFLRNARVLLKAAERPEGNLKAMPLIDAVRKSIETSQGRYHDADISLVQEEGDADLHILVKADDALPEVFTNLITNAVKFSSLNPVTTKVHLDKARNVARVAVEDSGPGIPDDLKHKIFDRTYTKGVGGASSSTGLGLAIVKALVDDYGGKVWADDRVKGEPGKGAKMVVELNLAS